MNLDLPTSSLSLDDAILIRSTLQAGDLSYLSYRQAVLYAEEYQFGAIFEAYLAAATYEFYQHYDPEKDQVWICEHQGQIIGSIILQHRSEDSAQLRYFYLDASFRNRGLGKRLMSLFMQSLWEKGYKHAYLWTISELPSAAALYKRYGFTLSEEKQSSTFGRWVTEQRYDYYTPRGVCVDRTG